MNRIDSRAFLESPQSNKSLQADTLKTLDLTGNLITTLSAGVFQSLRSLQWLVLSRNKLVTIPHDMCKGLFSLKGLYLYSNQLTSLPDALLDGTNTTILLAFNNNISSLTPGSFYSKPGLQLLHLSGNPLTHGYLM